MDVDDCVEVRDEMSPFLGWRGYIIEKHVGTSPQNPGTRFKVLVPDLDASLSFWGERQLKRLFSQERIQEMSWNIVYTPLHPVTWTAPQSCESKEEAIEAFHESHPGHEEQIREVKQVTQAKGRSQKRDELRDNRISWLKGRPDILARWKTKSSRGETLDANGFLWSEIVKELKKCGLVSKTTQHREPGPDELVTLALAAPAPSISHSVWGSSKHEIREATEGRSRGYELRELHRSQGTEHEMIFRRSRSTDMERFLPTTYATCTPEQRTFVDRALGFSLPPDVQVGYNGTTVSVGCLALPVLKRIERTWEIKRRCGYTPDDPDACMMCSGEACFLCGAGCWDSSVTDCEHDILQRHQFPKDET